VSQPRVVVVVTDGCHLCEDACKAVAAVCADLGVDWRSRDLFDLPDHQIRQWREYVPVVLIDGDVHDVFRVSVDRLRAALDPPSSR
jgi:hypothetical protein